MLKKHKIFAQEQNNNHTMESHQTIKSNLDYMFML